MVVSGQEQSLCAGRIIASRNDETKAPCIPAVCAHTLLTVETILNLKDWKVMEWLKVKKQLL